MNIRMFLVFILISSWTLDICTMLPEPLQFEQNILTELKKDDLDLFMHVSLPPTYLQDARIMNSELSGLRKQIDETKKAQEHPQKIGARVLYNSDYNAYISDNVEERVRGMFHYRKALNSASTSVGDIFDAQLPGLANWAPNRTAEKPDYVQQLVVCVMKMRNARHYFGTERPGWIEFLKKYKANEEFINCFKEQGDEKWPRVEATGSQLENHLLRPGVAATRDLISTLAAHALQVTLLHEDALEIKRRLHSFIKYHTRPIGGPNQLTRFEVRPIENATYEPSSNTVGSLNFKESQVHQDKLAFSHVIQRFIEKIRDPNYAVIDEGF